MEGNEIICAASWFMSFGEVKRLTNTIACSDALGFPKLTSNNLKLYRGLWHNNFRFLLWWNDRLAFMKHGFISLTSDNLKIYKEIWDDLYDLKN
jgi:hypothetical protein